MSSDYYGHIAGEIADEGPGDDYDSDDYDGRLMPPAREEPDWDAIAYEEHSRQVHGGGECNCPLPSPADIEAQWAAGHEEHRARVHGDGPCDCEPPF